MSRLTLQTAVASLVQFLTILILGVPDTIVNIVSTCHRDSSNCVSNLIVDLIFYLLTAGWFGIILLIGYLAQKKRSRQFAVMLGGLEFITLVVAGYIDFPHASNILTKLTSFIDALLSVWIIYLALRLFFAGNKRMVNRRASLGRNRNRN